MKESQNPIQYSKTDFSFIPSRVEPKCQSFWEANNLFSSNNPIYKFEKNSFPDKSNVPETYSFSIPPPNVTGTLHLGHALMSAIEDTIARYQRMNRKVVSWIPGTDHAGIATQTVVERFLYETTGKTREEIGREAFITEIWKWTEKHKGKITNQLKKIGCSLDWEKEFFTMEEKMNKAVLEAFIRLYKKGLIYREKRIVNMCCFLGTAVAEIEVDSEQLEKETEIRIPGYKKPIRFGNMIKFKYILQPLPFQNSDLTEGFNKDRKEEEFIEIETTRIETMLGDIAIAVHPKDKRFEHLKNRKAIHPFVKDRLLPIIFDEKYVEMETGTGAVKVTPFHDENDFEMAKRANFSVEEIASSRVIDEHGNMCGEKIRETEFFGLPRYICREKIIERLKELGLYVSTRPHKMILRKCSRTGDVIEPMLKKQWFLNCNEMAKKVLNALDNKEFELFPKPMAEKELRRWLEGIRDWCISRQLWWGHRIPVWYKKQAGEEVEVIVSKIDPNELSLKSSEKEEESTSKWEQDEDVLDTWFSSGLIPFAPMNWPNENFEEKKHLTEMLETGSDILFFWVARMLMLSMELTGKVPFKTVLLHGIVRDRKGAKMSKSKGNVLDPLTIIKGATKDELLEQIESLPIRKDQKNIAKKFRQKEFPKGIEECGADVLRMGLLSYVSGEDLRGINLDVNRVVSYKHFCNKIWNLCRFFRENNSKVKIPSNFAKSLNIFGNQNRCENENGKFFKIDFEEQKLSLYKSLKGNNFFADRWIIMKLNDLIKNTKIFYENYKFSNSVNAIFNFAKKELCDIYVEIIKKDLFFDSSDSKLNEIRFIKTECLFICIETLLRLLHPIMPHITEELWQTHLESIGYKILETSLVFQNFPKQTIFENIENFKDFNKESFLMERIYEAVNAFRSFASIIGFDYTQQKTIGIFVEIENENIKSFENLFIDYCFRLVRNSKPWEIIEKGKNGFEERDEKYILIYSKEKVKVYIDVDKSLLKGEEIKIIKNRYQKVKKFLEKYEVKKNKIKDDKVPEKVKVEEERRKRDLKNQYNLLESLIDKLKI